MIFRQPIIKEKKNGTIGNGVILQSHVSPRKVNRYVKRPEPTSIACTSSSASPTTSQTASNTTSYYVSDKECSSISSSTFDHNFDPNSQANQRKQDALFKEMLQKAPKHPQRYQFEISLLYVIRMIKNLNIVASDLYLIFLWPFQGYQGAWICFKIYFLRWKISLY